MYPWTTKLPQRISMQIFLGIILPTVVTFLLAAGYFAAYGVNILTTNYHRYALPFISLLITIFNGYYLVYYLFKHSKVTPVDAIGYGNVVAQESVDTTLPLQKDTFIAHTFSSSVPILTSEIAYFYRYNGHVFLRKFEGEDFVISQSLEQIEKALDQHTFFRVARYMIVNRAAIVSYAPLAYGKIGVTLRPPYKEQVSASKILAHNFRRWIAENSPSQEV
ncbi:LytTR family DNA-binding domain-containing protein [Pedobacter suwonensis]|uniref:LytTR family DNA-binding domain-containing protein n=1 Tax=Pedobacter suwonensis TaxID=332999 RepID=UPI0011136F3E|nr:LytTR family DNA-binding domain-containing protein [Pedobacter suwonensis]